MSQQLVSKSDVIKILDHPKTLENYANNALFNRDDVAKEIMYAIEIVKQNSAMQESDAQTVLQCCFDVVASGLTLNPVLGYAYLVPFKRKCKVMPSYKGLSSLVYSAGAIKAINAQIVRENDKFSLDLANNVNPVEHNITLGFRGKPIGVYAIATFANGSKQAEVMTVDELYAVRGMSEDYKYKKGNNKEEEALWVKHESEFFRKTVVKRLIKYLPKSESQAIKLGNAVDLDNRAAAYDLPVSFSQICNLDELLRKAQISEEQYFEARAELDAVKTNSQYKMLRDKLVQVQPKSLEERFDDQVALDK